MYPLKMCTPSNDMSRNLGNIQHCTVSYNGDCKLKVQLNACTDKYIDVSHDLSIKLRPQLTKNAQGYGSPSRNGENKPCMCLT